VIAAGKPLFIDKPLAATLDDAREIARLAKAAGVPWFSSSSLRWSPLVAAVKSPGATAVTTWGPSPLEEHHYLDLSWYGIHATEMLFAIMGTGCEEVTRTSAPNVDVVTCRWKDGRVGTVHGLRPYGDYGAIVMRGKESVRSPERARSDYTPMLKEIVRFFQTKVPPVPVEETLEIFAFMDAAQRSKEAGGKPMRLR
jgi:predicted dehydrogenase